MDMTYESMMAFAESWIAAWNRRDVEAVLAHYSEAAQFVSPVASKLVGRPILRNKKELEQYWRTALARISSLDHQRDRDRQNRQNPFRRWSRHAVSGLLRVHWNFWHYAQTVIFGYFPPGRHQQLR
jgi:hypothetical protein